MSIFRETCLDIGAFELSRVDKATLCCLLLEASSAKNIKVNLLYWISIFGYSKSKFQLYMYCVDWVQDLLW